MESDDRKQNLEMKLRLIKYRRQITELKTELAEVKEQRKARTQEADAAIVERDRARECEKRAIDMFLACYKAAENYRALIESDTTGKDLESLAYRLASMSLFSAGEQWKACQSLLVETGEGTRDGFRIEIKRQGNAE